MKLKATLEKVLGSFNEDKIEEVLASYVQDKAAIAKAESEKALDLANDELASLRMKIEEMEGRQAELNQQAALGKKYLEDTRAEVVALYRKAKGASGIKDVFLKTFEKADLELLQAWKEDYQAEVDQNYPMRCTKCSSTAMSRQSCTVEETGSNDNVVPFGAHTSEKVRDLHG